MEQTPVSFREPLQQFAHFKVIAGHGADLRDQLLTDIFGDGLLVQLGGEMIAALRGVFVEGALEEFQGIVDLTLELFFAELKNLGLFAHKYAYIYAYFKA